ncbi:MAG: D-tyrosyl-tRNA(Tyr) deacylase [Clostridium sp.]|nr:D-tyrosyl-tRNA(Tyr) deacylase [Clostridium sp.]
MRVVLQVVDRAEVTVDDRPVGAVKKGFLILLGVENEDTEELTDKMMDKICKLRIFEDENGKTNLSLADVGGEILMVSQFTLYADCHKGNRPSFVKAGAPEHAEKLYERAMERCRENGFHVEHGEFGAMMKISLVNSGPFTLMLDSTTLFR